MNTQIAQTNVEKAIEAAESVEFAKKCLFVNFNSLQKLVAEREGQIAFHLLNHPHPDVLNVENGAGHIYTYSKSPQFLEFLALKELLKFAESRDDVADAVKSIDPLLDKVSKAQKELARETQAQEQKRIDRERQKAEALAKLEADFADLEN